MFKSLRRALLGLAVITSATVAVPVTTSVVTASDGTLDNTTWGADNGGLARINYEFTEPGGNVRFTATTGIHISGGALLLAGYVGSTSMSNKKFASLALGPDGNPLNSFGQNGLIVYDLPFDGGTTYAQGAAEKIFKVGNDYVLAGWVGDNEAHGRPAMLRVAGLNLFRDTTSWTNSNPSNSGWIIVTNGIKLSGGGTRVDSMPGASFAVSGTTAFVMSTDAANSALTRVSKYNLSDGSEEPVGIGSGSKTFNTATELGTGRVVSSFTSASTGGLGVQLLVATRPSTTLMVGNYVELVGLDISMSAPTRAAGYNNGQIVGTGIPAETLSSIISLDSDSFLIAGSDGLETLVFKIAKSTAALVNPPRSILDLDLWTGGLSVTIAGKPVLVGMQEGLTTAVRLNGDLTEDSNFNAANPATSQVAGTRRISPACSTPDSDYPSTIIPELSSNFWLMQSQWSNLSNGFGASVIKFASNGMSSTACPVFPPLSVVGAFSINGMTGTTASMNTPTPTGAISNFTQYTYSVLSGPPVPCGLTLNSSTGKFEGTITSQGSGTVTVRVVNNAPTPQSGSFSVSYNCTQTQGQVPQNPNQQQACSPGTLTVTGSSPVLDTTWGTSGWRTLSVGSGYLDAASLVPTSPPGTYLLISATNGQFVNNQSNGAIDLRKVDASGASVNSFGTNGRLLLEAQSFEIVNSVRIDTSGRIYVSTTDYGPNGSTHYMVRLTSTGELDQTYGTSGVLTLSNLPGTQVGSHAVSAAGEVYVVSRTSGMNSASYVTKYSTSGLDANFANSGTLTTTSFGGRNVALMADGSLLVGGSSAGQLTLRKYSSAGVEDSSWATAGVATFGDTSVSESSSDVLVSGQSIYVAYRVSVSSGPTISISFGVAKLSLSGAVDTTFGVNGGVYGPLRTGNRSYGTTEVLSDGSILMAAFDFDSNGRPGASRFSRFSSTGQMDSAFELAETKVEHGTCGVDSPSIVDIGNGGILFAGGKVLPGFAAPTEAVIGKFSVGAITPGTAGGGFSAGGGNQQAPQNPSNQNPTPPVILPPSTPSVPPTPSTPALGIGAPASPPSPGGQPSLINTNNQPNLVAPPGDSRVVIGGNVVEPTTNVIDTRGSQVPPERRTNAQINEIRQQANELVQNFTESLPEGTQSPIVVVPTPTGAVIRNLVTDSNGAPIDVPAESVVVVKAQDLVLIVGGQRATVNARGEFQIPAGATVGVVGSGLDSEQYGEFVVMSTPTLIKNFKTEANGTFQESGPLPATVRSGSHTLVVASGDTYVTLGIEVIAPKLPVTGSSSNTVVVLALFTLVFGVILDRSRRIGRNVV